MVVYGGYDPTDEQVSTVLESENSRFQVQLIPLDAPILIGVAKGGPTDEVPVKVPGASKAYWGGWGNGRITDTNGEGGQMATLDLQLKGGQWQQIVANNIEARPDWKEQTLKAAANVVRQDRSAPMPFRVAGALPKSFTFRGGSVMRKSGVTTADLMYRLGPDRLNAPIVSIEAFTTGSENSAGSDEKSACKDSGGLTVCVLSPKTEPAELKAIGGPKALLKLVTSLGNDPADWTTDVIR
jgi:hypothetical protein